jgi:hypothetical protein
VVRPFHEASAAAVRALAARLAEKAASYAREALGRLSAEAESST